MFPEYLTNQSPWLFLIHFSFVVLIFLGQYFLCLFLQKRKPVFANVLLESFLFIPFFLFPLALLFSWLKLGNIFYGFSQILFATFALIGIYKYRNNLNLKLFKNIGLLEWTCYGVVFVLGYFGWLVPIPDNYNGHGHVLWNVLTRMLNTGSFDLLTRSALTSDDMTQLFFPPHFTFLLRFYCLNYSLFFYRSAILVSMIVGFLLIQVIKDICRIFNLPKNIGLLGFLAVIGTYFNALILYEIQYDVLVMLMLLFFMDLLGRAFVRREAVFSNILILLFFSFCVRTQVFIILFFAASLALIFYFKRTKDSLTIRPAFLFLGLFPVLIWSTVSWVKYDNPLWPMSRGIVERVFTKIYPHNQRQQIIAIEDVPLKIKANEKNEKKEEKNYGARVQYFFGLLNYYFPNNDWMRLIIAKMDTLLLFLIRAGPLSLTMAFIFLVLLLAKKMEWPDKEFLIIECLLIIGWGIEYILFYIGHNKFPHYLSVMTLFPAGFVLYSIEKKFFKPLPVVVVVFLFFNFNILLFGHRNIDFNFLPLQILLGQKTFIEKLAYKSNKSVPETQKESEELYHAYNLGKRILHIEVEPGGLLPSLMGREFFGEAFYFSPTNYQLKDVITAKNKEAMLEALKKRNIEFIFIPQRDRGVLESHPLFWALRELGQSSSYHLLVPVDVILKHMKYPLQ